MKKDMKKSLVTAFALTSILSGCSIVPETEQAKPNTPKLESEKSQQEKTKPAPYKGRTYIV